MYKALNFWVFGGYTSDKSPYEFIDFAAAQRLDGVELTVGDALPVDIAEAECRRIRAYAAERNIGLRTLATGFYWGCSLGSDDEAERQKAIAFTRRYLAIGSWLGVEAILVVPGATRVAWDDSRPVLSYKTVWEQSVKSLRELEPEARKVGVALALENVWNRFLLSPMEWKFYLDQFSSDYIGMYFDTGNCCYIGRPQDYFELLGTRIKAVHLKNFCESDCAGGLHGFGDNLLEGALDFPALFQSMKAARYAGPVTVEMIPFSRLPDLVLPDYELAVRVSGQLLSL